MSVNPFDPKTVVLAKHAQHVVLIHFPIALFIAGAAFDWMARWTKRAVYAAAAFFNFTLAALSTIPVVITGIVAWQWALEGQRLKGILLEHLVLGGASSVLMWIVFWIHRRARQKADVTIPGARIAFELLGVLLVSLTGHLGGFLSGVNGPG
jgi:uncharacterized membrane protein